MGAVDVYTVVYFVGTVNNKKMYLHDLFAYFLKVATYISRNYQ